MISLKKEVSSNQIFEDILVLQHRGFSRGRSFQLSRASKLSLSINAPSSSQSSDVTGSSSLKSLVLSSTNPVHLLGEIFADYEKLMGLQFNESLYRVGRRICLRLFHNVLRMKSVLDSQSKAIADLPESSLIEKAFEQIYLLIAQYSLDVSDYLLTAQCCLSLPRHPKANILFFTAIAGLGDVVSANRRFHKEEKTLSLKVYQYLDAFLKKSEIEKHTALLHRILDTRSVNQPTRALEPKQTKVTDMIDAGLIFLHDPSVSVKSEEELQTHLRCLVNRWIVSRSILPKNLYRTEKLQEYSTYFRLIRILFQEAQICFEYQRFGAAQLRYLIANVFVQELLSSQWIAELSKEDSNLFGLYERSRWDAESRSFLEDCRFRSAMNIALCKLRRQTRILTDNSSSLLSATTKMSSTIDSSWKSKRSYELMKCLSEAHPSSIIASLEDEATNDIRYFTRFLSLSLELHRLKDIERVLGVNEASSSPLDSRRIESIEQQILLLTQHQQERAEESIYPQELFDFQYRQTGELLFYLYSRRILRKANLSPSK